MKYRAVLTNADNGRARIESIWVEDIQEANRIGEEGLKFYGGDTFHIEDENEAEVNTGSPAIYTMNLSEGTRKMLKLKGVYYVSDLYILDLEKLTKPQLVEILGMTINLLDKK